MGSSEITFICGDKRVILTVTYKGGGGGSILFHQASWDPLFLADVDPEGPLDLPQLLSAKVCCEADWRFCFLMLLAMKRRLWSLSMLELHESGTTQPAPSTRGGYPHAVH